MKTQTLTASELEKLNNQYQIIDNLSVTLAKAALAKEVKIRQATSEYELIHVDLNKKIEEETRFLQKNVNELNQKYGPSSYNLLDGVVTPNNATNQQTEQVKK